MFRNFTSVVEAAAAVQDFLFDNPTALPEDIQTEVRALIRPGISGVKTVVKTGELLYARRDEIPDEAKELAAGLMLIAEQFNFSNMAENNRGSLVAMALMRDAQVPTPPGMDYPVAEDDPEPKEIFVKKDPVEPQVLTF